MHSVIANTNYLLILAPALIALVYFGNNESKAVYIFCFLCAAYGLLEEKIPDELGLIAYLGSAYTSLSINRALSKYVNPTEMISKIRTLCWWFIAANLLGWVAFMKYIDPIYYTAVCALLYSRMIIIVGGHANAIRNNTLDGGYIRIFGHNNASSCVTQTIKTETRD